MTAEELNREIASKTGRLDMQEPGGAVEVLSKANNEEPPEFVWMWYDRGGDSGGYRMPGAAAMWRQVFTSHIADRAGAGLPAMLELAEGGGKVEYDSLDEEIEILLDSSFNLEPEDLSSEALEMIKEAFEADMDRRGGDPE
jgi:hypothetical protein